MQRHHQVLAVAAILIIAASAAYLAIQHNREVGAQTPNLPPQEYENTAYGFSFTYPPQYQLNEYTDRYIELQEPETGQAIAAVEVELSDSALPAANYEDFVHASAENTCAADGPTGSIRCTGVTRSEEFTNAQGTKGEVFYLQHEAVINAATTTREAGPYYAFNITGASDDAHAAVLIRLGYAAEESPLYDEGAVLAHAIAESLYSSQTAAR
jgi:hypothetical protein